MTDKIASLEIDLAIAIANLVDLVFPMSTIKKSNLELLDRVVIQTAEIDIIPIWMRSRTIEGMNPAMTAKMMFGGTSIEGISTQIGVSLKQSESGCGDDEMDKSFFCADRTITFNCFKFFNFDSVANFATVTAAVISC